MCISWHWPAPAAGGKPAPAWWLAEPERRALWQTSVDLREQYPELREVLKTPNPSRQLGIERQRRVSRALVAGLINTEPNCPVVLDVLCP